METETEDVSADAALSRVLPARPDRVELAILTTLADTYGAELLSNASLGYALRLVARNGDHPGAVIRKKIHVCGNTLAVPRSRWAGANVLG
jgi:hypothetical protein